MNVTELGERLNLKVTDPGYEIAALRHMEKICGAKRWNMKAKEEDCP